MSRGFIKTGKETIVKGSCLLLLPCAWQDGVWCEWHLLYSVIHVILLATV